MIIKISQHVCLLTVALIQVGCVTPIPSDPALATIDTSKLSTPDISVEIPGLSACTTTNDPAIELDSNQPVTIIVHGCYGSAALFRSLAQVFAFHGQQTVCFNYNDRDSLMKSSAEFIDALTSLSAKMKNHQITVIGHSQGGLISRKALIKEREDKLQAENISLQLVTISSPFAGIAAADHCASMTARILSLGLVIPICKLISGDKWYEITHASPFIQEPGELLGQVTKHFKIDTDERDSCRQYDENKNCLEDDFVFSLSEQSFQDVDTSAQVKYIKVLAGHAEIVGNYDTPPVKLIKLMQSNGIMNRTPVAQRDKFSSFLSRLYQE
jgi:hypothetical protein